jgi:hypothetical protein
MPRQHNPSSRVASHRASRTAAHPVAGNSIRRNDQADVVSPSAYGSLLRLRQFIKKLSL